MSTNGCLSFPDAKPTDHSIYLQSSWNGPSGLRRAPFRSSSSSKCQVEKITICLSHLQKKSMIHRLYNFINCNRSAAQISNVKSSIWYPIHIHNCILSRKAPDSLSVQSKSKPGDQGCAHASPRAWMGLSLFIWY